MALTIFLSDCLVFEIIDLESSKMAVLGTFQHLIKNSYSCCLLLSIDFSERL